jgi:hypothetical protein
MIAINLKQPLLQSVFPTVIDCPHCGNLTPHKMVGENTAAVVVPGSTDVVEGQWGQRFMLKCQTCQQVSFYEKRWTATAPNPTELYLLYPLASVAPPEVPPKVAARFKEAMEVQNKSPSLCAVGLGKTLEAIMRDQNVPKKMKLALSIDHLVQEEKIPDLFGKMMHGLRELRNLGGHDDEEDDVKAEDIPVVIDFCRAIFEYLYAAPSRLESLKKRMEQEKEKEESH